MLPTEPGARQRLAEHMERRRAELNLRWQDVSEAADVSVRALQSVRKGDGELRSLTEAGIERGLQWAPGSVRAILAGGDPAELPRPAPAGRPPEPLAPERLPAKFEEKRALARPYFDEIVSRLLSAVSDPGGDWLFPDDPADAATWDLRADALSVEQRAWMIAVVRADDAIKREREPGAGSGGALSPDSGGMSLVRHDKTADISVPRKPLPESIL